MFQRLLWPVILLILAFPSGSDAQPKLEIPLNSFDFGFVPQYCKISHTFWLYSRGTDTLKILKVQPG